ncbi:MAG: DUF4279 domain-containing protein [Parvibaculum sp.]|nr:DUF4279 domain-containing protein [Parvibaculum sp.]
MNEAKHSIAIGFYLRGSKLKPDAISKSLGISPDRSQYSGEHHGTPTGRTYLRNIGLWALEAKIDPDSNNLSDYIDKLLSKIPFDHKKISELDGVEEACIDIFLAKTSDTDGGGTCEFEIRPDQIAEFSRIGVPVQFTITAVNP